MTYTRAQYMADYKVGPEGAAAHRRFHAQFVNEQTIYHVVKYVGGEAIVKSTDEHFNDIALHLWDRAAHWLPMAVRFNDTGDFPSDAGYVCVAKEAAMQYKERYQHAESLLKSE